MVIFQGGIVLELTGNDIPQFFFFFVNRNPWLTSVRKQVCDSINYIQIKNSDITVKCPIRQPINSVLYFHLFNV